MEIQGGGLRPNGGAVFQLDTVRALHQTIVSLRTALEVSKSELDDLRQKYETHLDTVAYSETIEKLTLENNILKGKLTQDLETVEIEENVGENVDSSICEKQPKVVTFALDIASETIDNKSTSDSELNTIIDNVEISNTIICEKVNEKYSVSNGGELINSDRSDDIAKNNNSEDELKDKLQKEDHKDSKNKSKKYRDSKEDQLKGEFETTVELESKFDVTIKVCAINDNGVLKPIEIETFDKNILNLKKNKEHSLHSEESHSEHTVEDNGPLNLTIASNEEIHIASTKESNHSFITGNNDRFNIQVKITSEENLAMDQCPERESATEHLNVEADEISTRSVSEGENSVFSEAGGTVTNVSDGGRKICEQDSISGNDSEEVDDIELIFTTDETKEFSGYQEDLVSITDGENWSHGDVATPILLKFNLLDPEGQQSKTEDSNTHGRPDSYENDNQNNTIESNNKMIDGSESSSKIENRHLHYKKGMLRSTGGSRTYLDASNGKQQDARSFESNESFSFDNKSFSFDNTKSSSIDRGSSVDINTRELSFDQKEESLDQLDALRTTARTHYTVCVETDISKCGVMEDDAFPCNLNLRRNTCPNPFQYRPISHRDAVKAFPVRPLLSSTANKGPRKSSAAQTDISALPNHWRSDTHLAKKTLPSALTTLPGRVTRGTVLSRLVPPAPVRPTRLSEENRRVLLSDIGFTSMVPELSRSAEPVWGALGATVLTPSTSISRLPYCCALHATNCFGSVPSSPTRQDSSNTNSKYWSKGSIQRSISGRMGEMTTSTHRVSFIDKPMRGGWRGSMPELRKSITCCSAGNFRSQRHFSGAIRSKTIEGGDSGDSTEELLDEAERFLRSSVDCTAFSKNCQDEWCPSPCSRPYLPSVPRQLRLGHLVKVIAPHGRIALGKVRYVGIAGGPVAVGISAPTYVGIQLKKSVGSGGGDGSFHGRRYFHCESGCSLFVPFSKIVVAWADV